MDCCALLCGQIRNRLKRGTKMKSVMKKILSVLLCFSLCMGFTVVPAMAMEVDDGDSFASVEIGDRLMFGRESVDETTRLLYEIKGHTNALWSKMDLEQKALTQQVMNMKAVVGFIQGISTVVSLVSGIISLLQFFGVFGDGGEAEFRQTLMEGIYSLQYSVEKIDKKVDTIQNTLVEEFSKIDLSFQTQEYNHYKDDVWAQFYAEAVAPLISLQNEYADALNWNMISYIEQWLEDGDCALRALFGEDGKGGYMQVFAARNLGEPGEKLPKQPSVSVDSIPVKYAVTLPGEYIADNMDTTAALTPDNCVPMLKAALEKGVYAAAEAGDLKAYVGFENEWAGMSEEEKTALASEFASYLADAAAFAAAYQASNEKKFASNVKSAFDYFCKWLKGADNLTSPMFAQLKMLSLTHAFEGEVTRYAETIYVYLELLTYNFAVFAETVLSMSKAHTAGNREDVRQEWVDASKELKNTCADFLTGNANYCYIIGKTIEYRDVSLESRTEYYNTIIVPALPEKAKSTEYWGLHDKTVPDAKNDEERALQSAALEGSLLSLRDLRTLACMYESQAKKKQTTSENLLDYLIDNNAVANASGTDFPYGVNTDIVTSCEVEPIDMSKGAYCDRFAVCSALGTRDVITTEQPGLVKNGKSLPIESDLEVESDNVAVHDRAVGGTFDLATGSYSENTELDVRIALVRPGILCCASDSVELIEKEPGKFNSDYTYTTSKSFGAFVEVPAGTYSFPKDTKEIRDNYFGVNETIEKLTLNGIPEKIGDNAFANVGSENLRCFLSLPEDFETGSLMGTWYGGYFGDTYILADKNDGSGEAKLIAAVEGAPCTSVLCPFPNDEIPEHSEFIGWSLTADGKHPVDNADYVYPHMTLYAMWKADHEHNFTVTGAKEATCTARGATGRAVCSVCGYTVANKVIEPIGHMCEFTAADYDNMTAVCGNCSESFTLMPLECGNMTAWATAYDIENSNVYMLEEGDGTLVIDTSSPVMVQTNGSNATAQRIEIAKENRANVALKDVNVRAANRASALGVCADSSLNLYLTDGSYNSLAGHYDSPALELSEGAFGLTVYGTGSLSATSRFGSAGIGSRPGERCPSVSILGGTVTATCLDEGSCSIGAPEANGMTEKIVIGPKASVMTNEGRFTAILGCDPVNEDGEKVYRVLLENETGEDIYIDSEKLPMTAHNALKRVYIYLTGENHDITVGGSTVRYSFVPYGTTGSFEQAREFGDFTVISSNDYGASYSDGVLELYGSGTTTVRNTDPSGATSDTIRLLSGDELTVVLDGVNIVSGDKAAFRLPGDGHETVIRLADGSVNTLVSGDGHAGIESNGIYSSLTITGSGSLSAAGGKYGAGIGSGSNSFVGKIIIENGNITAIGGEGGAGIGSGKQLVSPAAESVVGAIKAAESVSIRGGRVTAQGGKDAAGIGTGAGSYYISMEDISVSGGIVNAVGGGSAAGIGGGSKANVTNIAVTGGTVTAQGTSFGIDGADNGYGNTHLVSLVIGPEASVKGTLQITPQDPSGENVYLNTIDTADGKAPVINGSLFPFGDHDGEKQLYLYLAKHTKIRTLYRPEIIVVGGGTAFADGDIYYDGETVNLTAEAEDGYAFCRWETAPEVEISMNSFVMPEGGVTVTAVFGKLGKITAEASEYCEVMPSRTMAVSGEKITLRTVAEPGAEFVGWEVTPADLTITGNSFIMPECDVTVKAIYTTCPHTGTYTEGAKEASCTAEGSTGTEICSACGMTVREAEVIPAAGHTFGAEEVLAPTCTERGYANGLVCEVCGATVKTPSYTEALGHSFAVTPGIPATCTANGLTEGAACVRCGCTLIESKVIPATGHTFDDGVVVKVPTETEDGIRLYTCSVCKMSKAEVITVSDHVYVIDEGTAPTCTEDGSTVSVYCRDCGLVLLESKVIPAAGHDYLYEPAAAPTCVNAGHTASVICRVCGYVHTEMTTVPPTGEHRWDSGAVTKYPTSSAAGEYTYTCQDCGAERKDTIPADPDAGEAQPSSGSEYICAKCGRVHATNLLGRFNCFFFRVGDFFRNLFG